MELDFDLILQLVTGIVTICAALAAIVRDNPDSSPLRLAVRVVNLLALNVGRARNDPNAQ